MKRKLKEIDLLDCEIEIPSYYRDDSKVNCLMYDWSAYNIIKENKKRIIYDSSVMLFRRIIKKSGKCCCVVENNKFFSARADGVSSIAISLGACSHAVVSGEDGIVLATGVNGEAEAASKFSVAVSTGCSGIASLESSYGAAVSTGPHGTASATHDGTSQIVLATGPMGKAIVAGGGFAIATGVGGKAIALEEACVAIAIEMHTIAKGVLGAWIVVAGYSNDGYIECIKCAKVDGVSIKAGVYYSVYNGEFIEVQDKNFNYFQGYVHLGDDATKR